MQAPIGISSRTSLSKSVQREFEMWEHLSLGRVIANSIGGATMTSSVNTGGGGGGGAAALPALLPFCPGRGDAGGAAAAGGGSGAGSGRGWQMESAALTGKRPVLVTRTAAEWPDAGMALRKELDECLFLYHWKVLEPFVVQHLCAVMSLTRT